MHPAKKVLQIKLTELVNISVSNIYTYLAQIPATIPRINSETNPPPSIANVVCKYLRQFLGISVDVATLPMYCNIEQGGGT